jgi:hypothetical protein
VLRFLLPNRILFCIMTCAFKTGASYVLKGRKWLERECLRENKKVSQDRDKALICTTPDSGQEKPGRSENSSLICDKQMRGREGCCPWWGWEKPQGQDLEMQFSRPGQAAWQCSQSEKGCDCVGLLFKTRDRHWCGD